MKKHSLIISNYDDLENPYYAGGGAIAIHETAKRLTDWYDITILTGRYPEAKNITKDGVRYERIGSSFGGPKFGQLLYQAILPWYVLNRKYDLWIEGFTPPFSTGFVQLYTKKPVVGLIHMLSGEDMKRKYYLPFDLVERLGLKTYRHFITTSDAVSAIVRNANASAQIAMIPIGIDLPKKHTVKKSDYLLFLGRIEINQKGIDLLLEAYASVKDEIPYSLVIAGKGEEKQVALLKELLNKYHLTDSVRYIGHVTGEKKATLLSEARMLIVPSRFETFSLVSLEALAAGTPLVTFAIPGLSWIPNTVRIAVPMFSVQELAKAIRSISMDTPEVKKRVTVGGTFAAGMSWPSVSASYHAYLSAILKP